MDITNPYKVSSMNFENDSARANWTNVVFKFQGHYLSKDSCGYINRSMEFGPCYSMIVDKYVFNRILFEGYFYTDTIGSFKIASGIIAKDSSTFYCEFPVYVNKPHEWVKYQCVFVLPQSIMSQSILKGYTWNPNHLEVYWDKLKITLYKSATR